MIFWGRSVVCFPFHPGLSSGIKVFVLGGPLPQLQETLGFTFTLFMFIHV